MGWVGGSRTRHDITFAFITLYSKMDKPKGHLPPIAKSPNADFKNSIAISVEEFNQVEPEQDGFTPQKMNKKQSMLSLRTTTSSVNGSSAGRELADTFYHKLVFLKWSFMALICNVLLLVALIALASESGWIMSIGGESLAHAAPILVEVWMHFCHYLTFKALYYGTGAVIGYMLASKKGFSLAACGFAQTNLIDKFSFASRLSYRSISRKPLTYISYIWIIHTILIFFSVFATINIGFDSANVDSGTLSCLVFDQIGEPVDRGFPTLSSTMGNAEYIFGSAIGVLSSENGVEHSTFVFAPQLIDNTDDGATISGHGFQNSIASSCICSRSYSDEDLVAAGVDLAIVPAMKAKKSTLGGVDGMVNNIVFDGTTINITTFLTGTEICGGTNYTNLAIPVCLTTMADHYHVYSQLNYMSDGVHPSVAPNIVTVREVLQPANMTWLHAALVNIMGESLTATALPGTYPGSVNPLMWWTTTNMQSLSYPLLSTGFETTWAIILRSALQRTFSSTAQFCVQNIIHPTDVILTINQTGFTFGLIFVVGQLVMIFISFLAVLPWMISSTPLSPAIRLACDGTYFLMMLGKRFASNAANHASLQSSLDRDLIWQQLDVTVRIGESRDTVDDPDLGTIAIETPKLVSEFSWSKIYV